VGTYVMDFEKNSAKSNKKFGKLKDRKKSQKEGISIRDRVMLTCALRAHVNEPKKSNFALEIIIF
jgi:hypothetical protein